MSRVSGRGPAIGRQSGRPGPSLRWGRWRSSPGRQPPPPAHTLGGVSGDRVHRLHFKGTNTLRWLVHQHATVAALFGVAVIAVWLLHRRRGVSRTLEPLTVLGVLLAAQGLVGSVQYELHLPSDIVWVHVGLATTSWLAVLWVVAAAGRPVPRRVEIAQTYAPPLETYSPARVSGAASGRPVRR